MPAQRTLPPTPPRLRVIVPALVVGALSGFTGYVAGRRAADADRVVMAATPPDASRVALVRERPCDGGRCQGLWMGRTSDEATEVMRLAAADKVEEMAFSADGSLVGFVVNGYQLRVFESDSKRPRATVELLKPDRIPSSKIVRGVTFSANGAAVTFDECPRTTSGCKSGLAALR